MKTPAPKKITAADIHVAMKKTWKDPEWAIMWEVANATGAGSSRYADAVMMSLWPSRGLHLHGVEIKVSRSDWKREAEDPSKAEAIAAYCDYWWVLVAPGVIHDVAEIPMNWGAREWTGTKWNTLREATRIEPKACDRRFLAALLRRAETMQSALISAEVQKRDELRNESFEKRLADVVGMKTREATVAIDCIKAFETESGLSLSGAWGTADATELGRIVRLVREVGTESLYSSIRALAKSLDSTSAVFARALAKYDASKTTNTDEVQP